MRKAQEQRIRRDMKGRLCIDGEPVKVESYNRKAGELVYDRLIDIEESGSGVWMTVMSDLTPWECDIVERCGVMETLRAAG